MNLTEHRDKASGAMVHTGNAVRAGEEYPMIITRVWEAAGAINGQVLLDGNDTLWVTSVSSRREGEPAERHFR